jgi:hypothetical protein
MDNKIITIYHQPTAVTRYFRSKTEANGFIKEAYLAEKADGLQCCCIFENSKK